MNINIYTLANKIWLKVKLEEVLITSIGGTPDTSKREYWEAGNIPWINSGALKDALVSTPSSYITIEGLKNSSAKIFPRDTVLVALTGSTLGKVGLLGFECSTNQSVVGIYPSKFLSSKFLFYYFMSIRQQLIKQATGAAQPHINKRRIDSTLIPIAPIEHQKEVVKRLDKLFIEISELRRNYEKISSLEDAAFEGFIKKGERFYSSKPIGDFCKDRSERIGKDWKGKRLIGVSNEEGIIDLRISKRKSFATYKIVYPGDFIYNPMRVNIGSIAIYEGQEVALTSPDYIVFYVSNTLSKKLLLKFLKSRIGREEIDKNTKGSVRSRLYFSALAKIEIPFSSAKEQEKAEMILNNFSIMKEQANEVLSNVQHILNKSFARNFSENAYRRISVNKRAKDVVILMKAEREKNIPLFKRSNKPNIETMKKKASEDGISLLEMIKREYGKKRFTFQSFYEKSGKNYDDLKDELFSLIGKGLVLEFDQTEELMYFKIQ